ENRIGDVRRFSAGRSRMFNHRIEHLCRNDDRQAPSVAATDNLFLDHWYSFGSDLYPQVSTRNHDPVSQREDRIEIGQGFRFFNFGNKRNLTASLLHDLTRESNVSGMTDE